VETLPAPDTDARIAMLRRCVKLAKRCCADDAEGRSKVLAAQERLVAAIGANSLVPAAGDDLVELAPPAAVASIVHRQGALYAIMGQHEESLERFGRAVSMRREALGDAGSISQRPSCNVAKSEPRRGGEEEMDENYEHRLTESKGSNGRSRAPRQAPKRHKKQTITQENITLLDHV